jgi:hypothetical protein
MKPSNQQTHPNYHNCEQHHVEQHAAKNIQCTNDQRVFIKQAATKVTLLTISSEAFPARTHAIWIIAETPNLKTILNIDNVVPTCEILTQNNLYSGLKK